MNLKELLEQKKRELKDKKSAGVKTEKFKDGQTILVILPGWREGDAQFWHDFGMHYCEPEPKKYLAHICMDKTFQKECDICAAIGKSISMSNSDEEIDQLKKINASQRYLVNAVMIKGGKLEDEAVVFEFPATVFEQLVNIMGEWEDIIDTAKARPIIINREGAGLSTKYSAQASSKTVAITQKHLDTRADLDGVVAQANPTKLKQLVTEVSRIAGIHIALPAGSSTSTSRTAIAKNPNAGSFAASAEVDDAEFEEIPFDTDDEDLDELDFLEQVENGR